MNFVWTVESNEIEWNDFIKVFSPSTIPGLSTAAGMLASHILIEYGGSSVMSFTRWSSRAAAMRYYRSRPYVGHIKTSVSLLRGRLTIRGFEEKM